MLRLTWVVGLSTTWWPRSTEGEDARVVESKTQMGRGAVSSDGGRRLCLEGSGADRVRVHGGRRDRVRGRRRVGWWRG